MMRTLTQYFNFVTEKVGFMEVYKSNLHPTSYNHINNCVTSVRFDTDSIFSSLLAVYLWFYRIVSLLSLFVGTLYQQSVSYFLYWMLTATTHFHTIANSTGLNTALKSIYRVSGLWYYQFCLPRL